MQDSPKPVKRARRGETPETEEERQKTEKRIEKARAAIKNKTKKGFWDKYSYHVVFAVFGIILVGTLFSMLFSKSRKLSSTPVIEEDEIASHNENDYGYTLGSNSFFQDWKLSDAKLLMNNQPALRQQLSKCMSGQDNAIVEDAYDFREAHPGCVAPVINQTNCSSSYSIAAASAFSDRLCLETSKNVRMSPQVFLSCNNEEDRTQCSGGNVVEVVEWAKKHGFVDEDCLPYTGEVDTPCTAVSASCQRYYTQEFCIAQTTEGVKREILKNGPVVGVLPVYRDFLVYKSGVYEILEGTSRFQGGHAVKIIGWGVDKETKTDYWIVENSWGTDWGINGYAHIATGQKDLYFDDFSVAIIPKSIKEKVEEKVPGKEKAEQINLDE